MIELTGESFGKLIKIGLICSMFCALIRHKNILRTPTKALEFMNVILLHDGHRFILATYGAIFRVGRTRIQI